MDLAEQRVRVRRAAQRERHHHGVSAPLRHEARLPGARPPSRERGERHQRAKRHARDRRLRRSRARHESISGARAAISGRASISGRRA